MKTSKISEPWIVTIDDISGAFELVYWAQTEDEARSFYEDELRGKYPDREGRSKHIFKMIKTTGTDLQSCKESVKI